MSSLLQRLESFFGGNLSVDDLALDFATEIRGIDGDVPFQGASSLLASLDSRRNALAKRQVSITALDQADDCAVALVVVSGQLVRTLNDVFPCGQSAMITSLIQFRLEGDRANVFRDPWRLQTSRTSPVDHGLVREGAAHPSVGDSIAPELTDWSRVLRLPTHLARITTRLVLGYTTEAIAASEKLSISTVRTYIKNLYRITGVSTRSQLIALVVHTAASAHEAVQYPPAR